MQGKGKGGEDWQKLNCQEQNCHGRGVTDGTRPLMSKKGHRGPTSMYLPAL